MGIMYNEKIYKLHGDRKMKDLNRSKKWENT